MTTLISAPEQIDLALPALSGFYDFIGCWCARTPEGFLIVDPGPAATIPDVIAYLHERGATSSGSSSLTTILLTHIHVDHAGGTGLLAAAFPDATVICPARSIRHLVDPTRLEESSRTVLGTLMDHYGPIAPVPASRIVAAEESPWHAIATPGHSPDHTSYLIDGHLFCGEALGVICAPASPTYRRPATPPRFEREPYLATIDLLEQQSPHTACFGHFGSLPWTHELCAQSRQQITTWIEIVSAHPTASDETLIDLLLAQDPLFAPFAELPEPIQQRERTFVRNSLRGIRDFVSREKGVG